MRKNNQQSLHACIALAVIKLFDELFSFVARSFICFKAFLVDILARKFKLNLPNSYAKINEAKCVRSRSRFLYWLFWGPKNTLFALWKYIFKALSSYIRWCKVWPPLCARDPQSPTKPDPAKLSRTFFVHDKKRAERKKKWVACFSLPRHTKLCAANGLPFFYLVAHTTLHCVK